jgi:hypothetical protein
VVVLPAGTGHQRLSQTPDLVVIGAYPPNGQYTLCRGSKAEHAQALAVIPNVPPPEADPVFGPDGPLLASRLVTMKVYHEDGVIHVAIGGVPEWAEEFGKYLAAVVRAMLRDYDESFETKRKDGDVFRAICDGFSKATR